MLSILLVVGPLLRSADMKTLCVFPRSLSLYPSDDLNPRQPPLCLSQPDPDPLDCLDRYSLAFLIKIGARKGRDETKFCNTTKSVS